MSPEMASTTFSATVIHSADGATVMLSGELDLATAPELAHVLSSVLEDGSTDLVVDFANLSFIDSSGIAVLIAAQHSLVERGGSLAIHSARPHAIRVFEIAGLSDFLRLRVGGAPTPSLP